jgi:hypothetical protein
MWQRECFCTNYVQAEHSFTLYRVAIPPSSAYSKALGPEEAGLQRSTGFLKNGFASLAEHSAVTMNIAMIMSGIDPQTNNFTEPPERIRKEITRLKADKSFPEAQKKQILAQLEVALKNAKPIQFKENIASISTGFHRSCNRWDRRIRAIFLSRKCYRAWDPMGARYRSASRR